MRDVRIYELISDSPDSPKRSISDSPGGAVSEPARRTIKEVLGDVLKEVRPNPHTRKLEYMDLVAVKECTDARFLPERFRTLTPEELETRIDALRRFV